MAHTKITTRNITDDAVTSAKLDTNIAISGTLASTGVLTANAGVVVDNITIDGTEIDLSSGDLTLDVAGEIVLDADGGNVVFKDGGTSYVQIQNGSGSQSVFQGMASNQDMIFKVNDGGSYVDALTFDASDAGAALFNTDVSITTAGKRYYIPRASDAALTGSLYSPSGNDIRLSGAGSGSGSLSFEPASGSGVSMSITANGYVSMYRNASEYGLELKSAGTRSGLVLKKPGTDTIQGSVLMLADESFRLGTASVYNIQMYQNGIVMHPNQPYFEVYRSGNETGFNASGDYTDVVVYNSATTNIGGHYSTSTGYFTAPVTGVYSFVAAAYTNFTCGQAWFSSTGGRLGGTDMVLNGMGNFPAAWITIRMAANDTIGFHPYASGTTSGTINANGNHTYFRGGLIG